jgi:hypothetical protein
MSPAKPVSNEVEPSKDTLSEDSLAAPRYEKRGYDHRQQVVVGGVIMFCVALALVGMNNYNPRR